MLTPTPLLQTVNPNANQDITEYTNHYCNIIEMLNNPKDQEARIISSLTEMNDNFEVILICFFFSKLKLILILFRH